MAESEMRARDAYPVWREIATRWSDNDLYGHVNNVVHYSLFDTGINGWLIERRLLDIRGGPVIGLVAETGCRYARSIAFPQTVALGLRVGRLGRSSVRYEVGLFTAESAAPAAEGFFVHVYVDRDTRRPTALPTALREALAAIA